MKKYIALLLTVVLFAGLCGCANRISMPFNGTVEFNRISLTVPTRFVRDSTQSNEDLWIFEHGNYKEYVILSRKDLAGDEEAALQSYVAYMTGNGADSSLTEFLGRAAVHTVYYVENVYCQEILFCYDNSFYAVALRGGTEEGFREIAETIALLPLSQADQ